MMETDDKLTRLIERLSDGETHSGESLGALVSTSRAAVWKQLQKLEGLGVTLESVRGSGYRIPGGLDLLDQKKIQATLVRQFGMHDTALQVHSIVDSTNRLAMERLQGAGEWGVFHFAEAQTSGRGRRGRVWLSPYGASIYVSVAWVFDGGVAAMLGLSLAAGVVARQCLLDCGVEGVQLKWPNDLVVGTSKLGGILGEVVGDPSDICRIVLGLGINVRTPRSLARSIEQPWVNLDEVAGTAVSRNRLAATLVNGLSRFLSGYGPGKFSDYREEWLAADAYKDCPVTLSAGKHSATGIARGVDASGALMLEREGVLHKFNGGEVSLRAAFP